METFSALLAICAVNSPHKGQWRGALIFSLICVWINGWVNKGEAGDLRRYQTHYDVIVMLCRNSCSVICVNIFMAETKWTPFRKRFARAFSWMKMFEFQSTFPNGSIWIIPALVQIMAWCCPGDKPLTEPMIADRCIYASLGLTDFNGHRNTRSGYFKVIIANDGRIYFNSYGNDMRKDYAKRYQSTLPMRTTKYSHA